MMCIQVFLTRQHYEVMPEQQETPNGLEMSRPASASIVSQIRFAAAGRVGSIELLGGIRCLNGIVDS